MAGLREFIVEFGTEEQCIEHLAGLRWPGGFTCAEFRGRQAWWLKTRPRVYECATCHWQESATAGTVFHANGADQVVSCCLSDGQVEHFGLRGFCLTETA